MNNHKGGYVLGEGTYGCVFYPPIKCDGETRRRSGIGKVIQNTYYANDEINIARTILKFDPKGQFTNPIIDDCEIKKSNITKKDESNIVCGATSTLDRIKSYTQIIYKYKGDDLFTYEDKDIKKFGNLIDGLQLLQEHNICHRDLKEQNILVVKQKYIYIDFGLSVNMNNGVYNDCELNLLKYDYMYYPPEFKIYAVMHNLLESYIYDDEETLVDDIYNKMENMRFNDVYKTVKSDLKTLDIYQDIRTDVYEAISRIVHDTFKMSKMKIDRYFSKLAKYVDVFSLGIVMLIESSREKDLFDKLTIDQSKKLNSLIKKALCFNVFERCSVDDLHDNFKQFLTLLKRKKKITHINKTTNKNNKMDTHFKSIDNFTLDGLKSIAKEHSMKVSGNKHEVYNRVKQYLRV